MMPNDNGLLIPSVEAVVNLLFDYVVEQQLTEVRGWKYRVWKSGFVELWGHFLKEVEATTQPWIYPLPLELENVSLTANTSNVGNTDAYVGHCNIQNGSTDIWTKANLLNTVAHLFVYLTGSRVLESEEAG